jgi:hypothetical protein
MPKLPSQRNWDVDRGAKRRRKRGQGANKEASLGPNVLIWLRQDLRLHDNPTIVAGARLAASQGGTLRFVYIHSPAEDGDDLHSGMSS